MGEINSLSIVSSVTDATKADSYRAELRPILEQAGKIMDRAKADGLVVSWNLSPDQYGRMRVADISVVKPL